MRGLAHHLGWEFVVGGRSSDGSGTDPLLSNPVASESSTGESEQAARHARYLFFRRVAQQRGARYVATGHTANDQAETILHRILRGTGVAGLAGIPRTRQLGQAVTVVRPLLTFYRAELLDYLQLCGQSYCSDATNRDPGYTRNRIRHQLLPQLAQEYNPEIVESLLRLGRTAAESQAVIDWQVSCWSDRYVAHADQDSLELDVTAVAELPRHLVRQLLVDFWQRRGWPLRDMGYEQWDALATMLSAKEATARVFPGNVRVSRHGSRLCCKRR